MSIDGNQIVWLAGLLVLVFLLWLLSDILLPFVGGIALAYVQAPLADRLERLGMNRTLVGLLIVTVGRMAIILLTLLVLPLFSEQPLALIAAIPTLATPLQPVMAGLAWPRL